MPRKIHAYLMLDTRVLSFCIFTNQNGVDIIVWCLEALDGHAWSDVREQVEGPPQSQV